MCNIGSSYLCPMQLIKVVGPTLRYMAAHPSNRRTGPIKYTIYENMKLFNARFFLQYELPSNVIQWFALLAGKQQKKYVSFE